MRRIYDLKGLGMLAKSVADKTKTVRAHKAVLEDALKGLDTPQSKSKFTAQHITAEKARLQAEMLQQVRRLNSELSELTAQARRERHAWSRQSLLLDAFQDSNATDKNARALESIEASIRRLELSARLPRLKDDQLTAFAERAAESGDGMAVILAGEEGSIRGGLVGMQCRKVLDALPCPEAETAGELYTELAGHLGEAESIERLVQDPNDNAAHVRMRVAEIKRESSQDGDKAEDTTERTQSSQKAPQGNPAAADVVGNTTIINPANPAV